MRSSTVQIIPVDWPLSDQLLPLVEVAVSRLELDERLARVTLVLDAIAADDRAWFNLERGGAQARLTLWLHPDQLLHDRPGAGPARSPAQDWELGPVPVELPAPSAKDFSPPNALRVLYQQLLLVRDILDHSLQPQAVPQALAEAFQEAWCVTLDGRLQRLGLPHLSPAERRLRFLRLFGTTGVLTPSHWSIFNRLWDMDAPDQATVLGRVGQLPPLSRRFAS